jgi:hypothetical protein
VGDLPVLSPDAFTYYETLLDKHDHDGGTLAVVAHLWSESEACTFDPPETAVATALALLRKMNPLASTVRAAKAARESRESSLNILGDKSVEEVASLWHHLDDDIKTRCKLLRPLLAAEDGLDAGLLRRHWPVFGRDVRGLASRRLEEGRSDWAMRGLVVAGSVSGQEAEAFWGGLDLEPRFLLLGSLLVAEDSRIRTMLRDYWPVFSEDTRVLASRGLEEGRSDWAMRGLVVAGSVSGQEVGAFWGGLDLEPRFLLLGSLLVAEDSRVRTMLREYWPVFGEDVRVLASRRLDTDQVDWAVSAFVLANSVSVADADRLLGSLLVPTVNDDPDPNWRHVRGARSVLLRQPEVNPEARDFEETRIRLRAEGGWVHRVVRDFLYPLLVMDRNVDRAARWADWACRPTEVALPPWQQALRYASTGHGGDRGAEAVQSLMGVADPKTPQAISEAIQWTVIAFELAAHRRLLPRLLNDDVVADALLTVACDAHSQRAEGCGWLAAAISGGLLKDGLGSATAATVDAARVLLGGQPADFPAADRRLAVSYAGGFARALDRLAGSRLRDQVFAVFLDHLRMDQGLTEGALQFLRAMPPGQVLADYAADRDLVCQQLVAHE